MIALTLQQLLKIHALLIAATGGSTGLRDLGRLEAAIATQTQNVFGEELYSKIVDKAAAIIRGLIGDRPFADSTKRTAMLTGLTFLAVNRITFAAKPGEIEDFAVEIASMQIDVPQILSWLQECTV